MCNPGGHQYARAYLCNLKICQFNLFSKVEKFEYCISVANTAKSEHVLGRRKRKRIDIPCCIKRVIFGAIFTEPP